MDVRIRGGQELISVGLYLVDGEWARGCSAVKLVQLAVFLSLACAPRVELGDWNMMAQGLRASGRAKRLCGMTMEPQSAT